MEINGTKQVIADRIYEARTGKRWRQVELARRSGVAASNISKYEGGRRQQVDVDNLLAIADALGVSLDYLFGRTKAHGEVD
jgi:transcriptional regulator with XRE-family HTH domain